MTASEAKLLSFYAERTDDFRPSYAFIESATGIRANKVRAVRRKLVEYGVIAVTDSKITVDWERIRLFATLDPEQTGWSNDKRRKPHVLICPVGRIMTGDGYLLPKEGALRNGKIPPVISEIQEDLKPLSRYWDTLDNLEQTAGVAQ